MIQQVVLQEPKKQIIKDYVFKKEDITFILTHYLTADGFTKCKIKSNRMEFEIRINPGEKMFLKVILKQETN